MLVTANEQLLHSPAVISRAARVPVRLLRGRSSRREASRTPELVALNDAYLHFVWGNCGYYKGASLGYGHLTMNLALLTILPPCSYALRWSRSSPIYRRRFTACLSPTYV